MKKKMYFKLISSVLIIGCFVFLAFGSDDKKESKQEKKSEINCSGNGAYKEGHASGELVLTLGGSRDCSTYVNNHNESVGRDVLQASDCFCKGFDDAINGVPEK